MYVSYYVSASEMLLGALYEHWPQCRGRVAYSDIGTPLNNDFYLATKRGEVKPEVPSAALRQ